MKRLIAISILFGFSTASLAQDEPRIAIDPSGKRIARSQAGATRVTPLSNPGAPAIEIEGTDPAWTSDGKSLVVSREHDGRIRLFEASTASKGG